MARTIRSIATKVGAKAAIGTSTVLYSTSGNCSNDEELRPLLEPPPAPSSTRSSTDDFMSCDIDPEIWELEAAALRPDQTGLWQEECEARDKDMSSLHKLHTFGKYAQRTRTNKHGITRDNPDHHIVRIPPPLQNIAKSQKASMHSAASPYNASGAAKATWEQETGVVRETGTLPLSTHDPLARSNRGHCPRKEITPTILPMHLRREACIRHVSTIRRLRR